jgi:hypothetical protein
MSDISKCDGKDCSRKESCYRFTAPSNPYRQAYMSPKERGEKCEHYWEAEKQEKQLLKELNSEK